MRSKQEIFDSLVALSQPRITIQKTTQIISGGQEVENNHRNCAAYSTYSHALLTPGSGVFNVRNKISPDTKNTPINGAPCSFPDADARVLTPHHRNTLRHAHYTTQKETNQYIKSSYVLQSAAEHIHLHCYTAANYHLPNPA